MRASMKQRDHRHPWDIVWELTLEEWKRTGRPLVVLPRSEWPVRMIRFSDYKNVRSEPETK